ncbi:extracellular solute-binding protein [Paenibacillus radicis (ex Xue et al. 2023)]|uniref:Extracellular solute-binding protein n=1 Tax=Paenibacillus radicis (ex Xue et al. 2023) TaxID=2972489 RepID=A0ABT1YR86_9BACL|nr:extracellular solute-binding protein [Paenibacillus radicis (ex Xue et al. 2023)]MCR8635693.1 extracellular solute-binding protein [Paenibacillus radicis (ex Xue et al. 2023)]
MTRTWVKGLSLSLCTVMVASGLAACSSGGKEASSPSAGNGNTSSKAAGAGKISEKEREVKVTFPEHPNQPVKNYALVQQEIFNQTNIKLKFENVPNSNYNDKKKTLLATNNLPDIIQIEMSDVNNFGSTGVFVPLLQYMNKGLMPNFKKFWDQYPDMVKLTADGELYGFPAIGRNELKNGFGPVIRTDLLKKHNLPVPKSFDELLTVLAELKKLYPDSTPFSVRKGSGPIHQLFKTMAYPLGSGVGSGNGIYFDKDVNGGQYLYGPATPQFKEVLAFFNKAFSMGVLDKDYAVATQQQWTEKLTSGKSFFFMDNSGFALDYTKQLQKAVPDGKFQIIPIPTNKSGKARAEFYATTLTSDRMFAISSKAKDPETLIKLIDWMYTEKASNLMSYGIEGVHHTLDDKGQPKLKAEYVAKFKEGQPTPFYAMYSELGSGKLSFTPWFANMDPQVQVEKLTGSWSDVHEEYWKTIADDKAYHDPYLDPPLTKEEAARVKEILAPLTTMLEQEYDKFIMGVKKIDEYDAVMKKARDTGGAELEKIYNGALARLSQKK